MPISLHRFPPSVCALLTRAARQTLGSERPGGRAEINIILVSDQEIKRLNRRFRRVNRITDVISFSFSKSSKCPIIGDIYIARSRSRKQARCEAHAWDKELAYLVIHGMLHLAGYTDYTPRARQRMFVRQDALFLCLFS